MDMLGVSGAILVTCDCRPQFCQFVRQEQSKRDIPGRQVPRHGSSAFLMSLVLSQHLAAAHRQANFGEEIRNPASPRNAC